MFSLLGLAAFLAVEALLLRHYISVDKRPPSWDQATHMEIALDYREAIGAGRWSDMWYLAPKPGMPPFPPAYHLLLRGAYASSDPAHAALCVNWFYMAILAFSLFGICWRFLPDGRALAATLAFCAAPGLQDLLTTQLVDLAMVAWACAAYFALLESEGFTGWLPALGFGVLHAAGMMHKWSFFSYMLPAYIVAGRALGDRGARLKVLAAAALSLALSAPWYWSHLALLPSRLVQASSDFATPFWKDNAWAAYLGQASSSLGPLLWALGFISLLAPQYSRRRENGWIIGYWVVFSYVFWTVVPNRQIRFLLPGLAPLGLAMAATWPRQLSWGVAAFQVLGALNFFFGVVGPVTIPTPLQPLTLFVNRPPLPDDWKTEEILRRIETDRDPSRPITNVTLVANDEYFNGPTFHWAQRYLKLPHARMRGVNKRLCELSEFVLIKDGRLGPPTVIGGLPEAAKVVHEPDGWFQHAYARSASWPLPDGSVAVLYHQKRSRPRPMDQRKLDYTLFQTGDVRVRGMHADLGDWDQGMSAWRNVMLSIDRLEVRGLAVRGVAADVENFSLVPMFEAGAGTNFDWSDVRLMRVDRVVVRSLQVGADDLKAFVEARVPGLKLNSLTLDGTVKASGDWRGRRVEAEAALELDRAARRLKVRILSASYMGTPVPPALFRPIKELDLSLEPNPETPFSIELAGLTIKDGRLTVP
ncbi:MAG: hypothetical protein HY079_03240 [Elusimicrobia bacterium]|nr:hypothetical protein [Elusimicrobiota bacterium]